jgi:GTP-binding protein
MKFVDYTKIHIRAGDGGRGCVSFRREKYVPRGGPDGGDGGRGGHIIIKASTQLYTLLDQKYKKTYRAKNGQGGMGKNRHGRNGDDLIIKVPAGTVVKDAATGDIIADLTDPSTEIIVAKGGRGGLGNAHFATPTRQAPRYAQPGEPGEEKEIILELKLLADVGLIGLPNAGKSTLISRISAARPKIADYPFTTLTPNLGTVKTANHKGFVVADIPGLIENAHKGAGLGFQFLRHIERTELILHLVDVSEMTTGDPVKNLERINLEMKLYSDELTRKPMTVCATKIDIASPHKIKRLSEYCKINGIPLYKISAVTGAGIEKLIHYLAREVERLKR